MRACVFALAAIVIAPPALARDQSHRVAPGRARASRRGAGPACLSGQAPQGPAHRACRTAQVRLRDAEVVRRDAAILRAHRRDQFAVHPLGCAGADGRDAGDDRRDDIAHRTRRAGAQQRARRDDRAPCRRQRPAGRAGAPRGDPREPLQSARPRQRQQSRPDADQARDRARRRLCGSASGLFDAETNLTYAVRYLAGAYRAAGGNHSRAVAYYASGYHGRGVARAPVVTAQAAPTYQPMQAMPAAMRDTDMIVYAPQRVRRRCGMRNPDGARKRVIRGSHGCDTAVRFRLRCARASAPCGLRPTAATK